MHLVALEKITGIDLVFNVIKTGIVTIGNDGVTLRLELLEIIDDKAAEKGLAILLCWLVDDDVGAFGFDALHDALDGGLAEVVGVGLHGEAVDADGGDLLNAQGVEDGTAEAVVGGVGVPASFREDLIGDEVLAGAVGLDDGGHHVLRDVLIVSEELLGVLGEAVTAVTEGWVVVVGADAGIETDALDDGLGVETFDLGIGVELVEVGDAKGKVGVGKELDGFGLFEAHEKAWDAFGFRGQGGRFQGGFKFQGSRFQGFRFQRGFKFQGVWAGTDGAFEEEVGEGLSELLGIGVADGGDGGVLFVPLLLCSCWEVLGIAYDDAAGPEVVFEGLALAEELWGEKEVEMLAFEGGIGHELEGILDVEGTGVAYGDGALDDHDGVGVDAQDEVDDVLDVVGVEEVLDGIVVGGGGDDDEVGVAVG